VKYPARQRTRVAAASEASPESARRAGSGPTLPARHHSAGVYTRSTFRLNVSTFYGIYEYPVGRRIDGTRILADS
jgi:hypothetical protein